MVVDRIEGAIAVVEKQGQMVEIALSKLPLGVAEGDVLVENESGYSIDKAAARERKAALFKKQTSLFKRR